MILKDNHFFRECLLTTSKLITFGVPKIFLVGPDPNLKHKEFAFCCVFPEKSPFETQFEMKIGYVCEEREKFTF